jgi:hypothetical protein
VDRGSNHSFINKQNSAEDNTYSMIGVSFNLDQFAGHEGNIMSLTLAANDEFDARDAEFLLSDVLFVDVRHRLFLAGNSSATIAETTAIEQVTANKEITSVRYINVAGQQSEQPFDGINIVVTTYSDGTTSTVKMMK